MAHNKSVGARVVRLKAQGSAGGTETMRFLQAQSNIRNLLDVANPGRATQATKFGPAIYSRFSIIFVGIKVESALCGAAVGKPVHEHVQ